MIIIVQRPNSENMSDQLPFGVVCCSARRRIDRFTMGTMVLRRVLAEVVFNMIIIIIIIII